MRDAYYLKIRSRVERRLSQRPRLATIHALLFTLICVPLGFWGIFTHPVSINGVAYWVIFLWSIVLFGHVAYSYINSGAWARKREKHIQEEVLDAGETYDLDQQEMVDLHLLLRDDLQKRSQGYNWLMLNALGNVALWPGLLLVMLFLLRTNVISGYSFSLVFRAALLLALLGTATLGLLLPIRELRRSQPNHGEQDLSAIYGYRRKRKGIPQNESLAHLEDGADELDWIVDDSELKRQA